MENKNTSNPNQQTLTDASEQQASGKPSVGLKIRARVGMQVRSRVKTGASTSGRIYTSGTGVTCDTGGSGCCTETAGTNCS